MTSFNYKKYRPSASQNVVNVYNENYTDWSGFSFIEVPKWLTVSNFTFSPESFQFSYDAAVNQRVANTLNPGVYTGVVRLKARAILLSRFDQEITVRYAFELNVIKTVQLDIKPTQFNFEVVLGSTNSINFPLRITSENSWFMSRNQSWITLTQFSGVGNGLVRVGVDVNGLTAGNYTGDIILSDGYDGRTAQVTLIVKGAQNENEFLKIRPAILSFVEKQGAPATTTKSVTIESSNEYRVTSTKGWIIMGNTMGAAGSTAIDISTDTTGLSIGLYQGVIEVASGDFVENIYVNLRITDVKIMGLESDNLYYADDRNELIITSSQDNTIADIDFEVNTDNQMIPFNKKVPFYRAAANVLIGLETENLLRPNMLIQLPGTRVLSAYNPLRYDFRIKEKQRFIAQSEIRDAYTNVQFINGKTPEVTDRLTYMPTSIATTKDAVLALSVLQDTLATGITITGAVTDDLTNTGFFTTPIQTAIIDLNSYPTLSPGDRITISFGGQAVDVLIKSSEAQHTQLIFENEWNLPEYYMLTGELQISTKKGWRTAKQALRGKERTYIYDTQTPMNFKVNSGWVYSQQEVEWLAKIFHCKRFYLMIDGDYIEVIPSVSQFENRRTRKELISFDLNFKKAIL